MDSLRIREMVLNYLNACDMDYRAIDFMSEVHEYLGEMENGLAGRSSSLQMIPSYIRMPSFIPTDEQVIAIDAGGTNLRIALVRFDASKRLMVTEFQSFTMPGVEAEVSRDEFFDVFAGYLRKYVVQSGRIGFCFSYPVQMQPDRDGKLVYFTKEVKVRDSSGMLVAASLRQGLERAGIKKPVDIAVLNDTVATLLGGKAATLDRNFGTYIGFILGTGTNTAYEEECRNISKQPAIAAEKGQMIINVESGGYGKMPRGAADLEIDKYTVNPGQYRFEKMVSGRYQGELALAVLKNVSKPLTAADNGKNNIFSEAFAQRIDNVQRLASSELDEFLVYPYRNGTLASCCNDNEDDRQATYHFIDCLTERSAKLIAINLSAVAIKTGKASKPHAPVCITADGSTFYKSRLFRSKLDHYVKTYLNEQSGCYCEFIKADNPTITGTAVAALS